MHHYFNNFLSIVQRCFVTKKSDDKADLRIQQIEYMENPLEVEVYFPYGMSGNVPADGKSLCLKLIVNDDSGNVVILPDRSRDRVKNLEEGEVAFFHPITKSKTVYRNDGSIEIESNSSLKIVADKNVEITSKNGNIKFTTPNGEVRIND